MKRFGLAVASILCVATAVFAMGEEELGNGPVNSANYVNHPGMISVINDSHRVYRWWVNGNEQFFFKGDSIGLNTALEEFAKVESTPLEVVLRPGPATTGTFHGDREIHYNWSLQVIGGIAGHMGKRDQGKHLWPSHPVLSIYVGGPVQLSELAIPDNVTVIGVNELKERYKNGFSSTNQDVRGWTCGRLAELDHYDVDSLKAIEKMLSDESQWVRSNAAGALASFADKATESTESLKAAIEEADESLKKRIEETMAKANAASPNPEAERRHTQTLAAIDKFCDARAAKE